MHLELSLFLMFDGITMMVMEVMMKVMMMEMMMVKTIAMMEMMMVMTIVMVMMVKGDDDVNGDDGEWR